MLSPEFSIHLLLTLSNFDMWGRTGPWTGLQSIVGHAGALYSLERTFLLTVGGRPGEHVENSQTQHKDLPTRNLAERARHHRAALTSVNSPAFLRIQLIRLERRFITAAAAVIGCLQYFVHHVILVTDHNNSM